MAWRALVEKTSKWIGSRWYLSITRQDRMPSLACTQVADLQESARAFIQIMISPLAVHTPTPRVLAMKPLESWTSEAIAFDCDRISKIRARQSTENRLLYTGHAVDRRESERCEQEVGRQKPYHVTRPGPVDEEREAAGAGSGRSTFVFGASAVVRAAPRGAAIHLGPR